MRRYTTYNVSIQKLTFIFSEGSVATSLRCDRIFNRPFRFIANLPLGVLLLGVTVK